MKSLASLDQSTPDEVGSLASATTSGEFLSQSPQTRIAPLREWPPTSFTRLRVDRMSRELSTTTSSSPSPSSES